MTLERLRVKIDRLDARIVGLLAARVATAKAIGEIKSSLAAPIIDEGRESRVLERVKALCRGRVNESDLEAIYRLIIRTCAQAQLRTGRPKKSVRQSRSQSRSQSKRDQTH